MESRRVLPSSPVVLFNGGHFDSLSNLSASDGSLNEPKMVRTKSFGVVRHGLPICLGRGQRSLHRARRLLRLNHLRQGSSSPSDAAEATPLVTRYSARSARPQTAPSRSMTLTDPMDTLHGLQDALDARRVTLHQFQPCRLHRNSPTSTVIAPGFLSRQHLI
jgi:hypothetical protein